MLGGSCCFKDTKFSGTLLERRSVEAGGLCFHLRAGDRSRTINRRMRPPRHLYVFRFVADKQRMKILFAEGCRRLRSS